MPADARGQLITFATESEDDRRYIRYVLVPVRKHKDRHGHMVGETVKQIAARYGHPEDAKLIRDINGISSITKHLSRKTVRIPGKARPDSRIQVVAGEEPPRVTGGYAKFSIVDRPYRTGLTKFDGYDPIQMEFKIRFEAWVASRGGTRSEGPGIESDIEQLERMAGRGSYAGAAIGPPAVVHISTTDAFGTVIPLVPLNYQRYAGNPSGPLWRITGIDWDSGALRDSKGRRVRQEATVTVQQHTKVSTAVENRSASHRAKGRKRGKGHLVGTVVSGSTRGGLH